MSLSLVLVLGVTTTTLEAQPGGVNVVPLATELTANDIVFDTNTETLWASVPSSMGRPYGNHIVPVDPESGELGTAVFAGSEPNRLALSDDGSILYIALDGNNRIVRFFPETRTLGDSFEIGDTDARVEDMEVVPGDAGAIAVSINPGPGTSRNIGVTIFVDGVALPNPAPSTINAISFSDNPSILYGHNSGISPHTTVLTLSLNLQGDDVGLEITHETPDTFEFYQDEIDFDGGRIYSNRGQVIDPVTHDPLGEFDLPGGPRPPPFAPDSHVSRTFYLLDDEIRAFDQRTFLLSGAIDLGDEIPDGRRRIIRWGVRGLAFLTDSSVHVFESDLVPDVVNPTTLFGRGDVNSDGQVNLSDGVRILDFLFRGETGLECENAADVDDDGGVLLTDAVFLLAHLFQQGAPIPPPAAPDCGEDPTASGAACQTPAPCA